MSDTRSRTTTTFDAIEACGEAGCPLCRLNRRVPERYVDAVLYEMVNDPNVRADFGAARGYCNRHAWMMPEGHGRSPGIALMQRTALIAVLQVLDEVGNPVSAHLLRRMFSGDAGAAASPATRDLATALEPDTECPACHHESEMEHVALAALLDHLDDADMAHGFGRSSGLCLPHFRRALSLAHDDSRPRRSCRRPGFRCCTR